MFSFLGMSICDLASSFSGNVANRTNRLVASVYTWVHLGRRRENEHGRALELVGI